MSAKRLEAFLARLYVDATARERFKANPIAETKHAGLSNHESNSLSSIDWTGLEMAARSFAKKRELKRASNRLAAMRWLRTLWHSWPSHSRRLWHKQTPVDQNASSASD
jgi:hypothetical protein